ncbi:hypothetical protein LEMLEM_LOCUS6427, partial [Lemmus lemmus]
FFFLNSGPLFSGSLGLEEGVRPLGSEARLVLAPQNTVGQRELDLGVMELFDSRPPTLAGRDLFHLHDLDGVCTGTVPGPHVSVALCDSPSSGQVAVLTVHVVCPTAGVIAQPDAEVLHAQGGLLEHLPTVHYLPGSLPHLLQLRHEIPEVGLGHHMVGCEDAHSVQWWRVAFGSGQAAPHHLVLPECARGLHGGPFSFAA